MQPGREAWGPRFPTLEFIILLNHKSKSAISPKDSRTQFFPSGHQIFIRTKSLPDHKKNVNTHDNVQVLESTFSEQNRSKLEISDKPDKDKYRMTSLNVESKTKQNKTSEPTKRNRNRLGDTEAKLMSA